MAFCLFFTLLAVVFFFIRLPNIGGGHIESGAGSLCFPHMMFGVVGNFMHVGAEVGVGVLLAPLLAAPIPGRRLGCRKLATGCARPAPA